jgi:hypothetical protein
MNLLKYIHVPVFLFSLAFGLFAVYITMPETRTILVYPTPENVNMLQYRDKTNTCFSVVEQQVKCPMSEKEISKIPVQA